MSGISQELVAEFSGPILFNYVWWVLHEATQKGIACLYFLARDGYTLHRIAELFCRQFDLNIECKYLYCSRASLRMPSYFLIGEEAFDLLLLHGYYSTLENMLKRGGLSEEERNAVYEDCDIGAIDKTQVLSREEFDRYALIFRKNRLFRRYVLEHSRQVYADSIGYFRGEGLFGQETVAVVDSGWTGSMQRSLRQLLEFSGFSGNVVGFYFGMYARPKLPADGEYYTWYFDAKTNKKWKIWFCNNLFECMLSAPHGMTVSYRSTDRSCEPVFLPPPTGQELQRIQEQSDAIYTYSFRRLAGISFDAFDANSLKRDTTYRIKRYMFHPTCEEAAWYGQFLFCDDVTEAYHLSLASEEQKELLRCYSMPRRVMRRVFRRPLQGKTQAELFWPFGTIAFLPHGKQWWYRWNIVIWEWLRYTLHQNRGNAGPQTEALKYEDYQKFVDGFDVVSFDIFDTLLYRALNGPTDVFRLMELDVEEQFGICNFAEKRVAAEHEARCRTAAEDIKIREIYAVMQMEDTAAEALIQLERKAELEVLRRDRIMPELLTYCISQGKKVLIISDMYQDQAFLREALDRCGIQGYHALYVSSEEMVTKASGNLFRRVAEKVGIVDGTHWLHIGDNVHSDYDMPQMLGLSALLYRNGRASEEGAASLSFRLMRQLRKIRHRF